MAHPHTFEDTIRKHDVAIYSWLDDLKVDYGDIAGVMRQDHPILRVMAAPHRAFAQAHDSLVKLGWVAGESDEAKRIIAEADWSVLPLPFVTIDRDDPIFSPELAAPALNMEKTFRDPNTGEWVTLPYPLHMLTTYRLTFWCLKRYTEAFIMEWFYSRFGMRGAGPQEVYLTVKHDWPFGDQLHALRWIGSADFSDLEGENPRYIRMQASLIFRTWLMRGDWPTAERGQPVHTIRREAYNDPFDLKPTAAWWGSGNLFQIPMAPADVATHWPVDGNAVVGATATGGLHVGVVATTDEVGLTTVGAVLNDDGYELFGLSASVTITGAPITLRVQHASGNVNGIPAPIPVPVYKLNLPVGASTFHEFTLSAGERVSVLTAGTGTLAAAELEKIDIRHIEPGTQIAQSSIDDLGASWGYKWSGLDFRPHIVVIVLQVAVAGQVVTFENDDTVATFTRPRTVSLSTEIGIAVLLQPKASSLRVVIPKTMIVADAYVQSFDGPYLGGTLLP